MPGIVEIEIGDPSGEIDTDIAGDADGVQHDLVAADQCIGAGADGCRDLRGRADIIAGDRARTLGQPG